MSNGNPRDQQRPRRGEKKRVTEGERKSGREGFGSRKPPRLEGKPVERRKESSNGD